MMTKSQYINTIYNNPQTKDDQLIMKKRGIMPPENQYFTAYSNSNDNDAAVMYLATISNMSPAARLIACALGS